MRSRRSIIVSSIIQHEPPWYGTVCPVVWEDGGSNPASYPMSGRAASSTKRHRGYFLYYSSAARPEQGAATMNEKFTFARRAPCRSRPN